MDVLNAELEWIGNRCYRVLGVQESIRIEEEDDVQRTFIQEQDDDYEPDLPILLEGNKFYVTIHVPASLLCHIYGRSGKKKRSLEENGAKVIIPQNRNATAGITITGDTKRIVSETYHRIEDIVNKRRLRTDATHFISLPINSSEIKESFLKFRNEVLAKYSGARGVEESIFQNPNKLHVTVAPLVLLDERDTQSAIAILKNSTENILKHLGAKKFIVQVKGIEYMNDDPAEVDVLYAKLQELNDDNSLQIIADSIMKECDKHNLSKSQQIKVKLHVTIMNTLFRINLDDKDGNSDRITFDASGILRDFAEYDFGQIVLSEMHLSVRYTTSQPDGYYVAAHKIKLNQ